MGQGDGRRHTPFVHNRLHGLVPARLASGQKNGEKDIEQRENRDANSEDSGPGLQFQQSDASGEVGETEYRDDQISPPSRNKKSKKQHRRAIEQAERQARRANEQ